LWVEPGRGKKRGERGRRTVVLSMSPLTSPLLARGKRKVLESRLILSLVSLYYQGILTSSASKTLKEDLRKEGSIQVPFSISLHLFSPLLVLGRLFLKLVETQENFCHLCKHFTSVRGLSGFQGKDWRE